MKDRSRITLCGIETNCKKAISKEVFIYEESADSQAYSVIKTEKNLKTFIKVESSVFSILTRKFIEVSKNGLLLKIRCNASHSLGLKF